MLRNCMWGGEPNAPIQFLAMLFFFFLKSLAMVFQNHGFMVILLSKVSFLVQTYINFLV